MQTLWYGNWPLQKPARIHTSMHWNHLRNVRWDGTSSQDNSDKWTKPACLGVGERWGGGRGRRRGWEQTICPPIYHHSLPNLNSYFLALVSRNGRHFLCVLPNPTSPFNRNASKYWQGRRWPLHHWESLMGMSALSTEHRANRTFCLVFQNGWQRDKKDSFRVWVWVDLFGGETVFHTAADVRCRIKRFVGFKRKKMKK